MKQPSAFKPTALAVEDYLKRTTHSKESVRLATVDAEGRVGNVVIYHGELWSAKDTQGVGELALLRLMNERVTLNVEELSELDRGPRNITDSRCVLLMRASFESQAALDPADDSPTSIWWPRPRNPLVTEAQPEPPTEVMNPKLAAPQSEQPLPPPKPVPPEVHTASDARRSGDRSPTTLSPLSFDAASDATQTSRTLLIESKASAAAPAKRHFRRLQQVAAVVVFGSMLGVLVNVWPQTPNEAEQTQQPPQAAGAPAAAANVATDSPSEGLVQVAALHSAEPQAQKPGPVVARVRAVGSSNSLGGADLSRYVYSITGQFLRCYDWAVERAQRDGLGAVAVRVSLNDDGSVASSVATGGKIRGLNSCVADVAGRLPALMHLPHAANTLRWVVAFEND